jgi:hypothetical protein
VTVDDPLLVLFDVVLERRWQLVSARQKTLCRIHDQLAYLLPAGAAKGLTADKTAAALRRIRPTDPVGIRRRLIVRGPVAELRAIDRKIAPLDADITWMLDEHGTRLTDIVGIGRTGAATILAIVGDPARFRSVAAFASFAGTAPIAASSGDDPASVEPGRQPAAEQGHPHRREDPDPPGRLRPRLLPATAQRGQDQR